jgi:tripartite-type tricarboxylate transporter receptor subunit TctC
VVSETDYAVFAPAGAPKEAITLLNREINAVLAMEEFRAKLALQGIEIAGGPPDALREDLLAEYAKWARVIREAGLKPE